MVKTKIMEEWVENTNYRFIEDEVDERYWNIEILTGQFEGLMFRFDVVRLGDDGIVQFEYTVTFNPISDLDESDEKLQNTLSHILHSVLMNNYAKG